MAAAIAAAVRVRCRWQLSQADAGWKKKQKNPPPIARRGCWRFGPLQNTWRTPILWARHLPGGTPSRCTQACQERQQTQQETQNAPKKRPRAKHSANKATQTRKDFDPLAWLSPALRYFKQVLNACILKHIALTRLGTTQWCSGFHVLRTDRRTRGKN